MTPATSSGSPTRGIDWNGMNSSLILSRNFWPCRLIASVREIPTITNVIARLSIKEASCRLLVVVFRVRIAVAEDPPPDQAAKEIQKQPKWFCYQIRAWQSQHDSSSLVEETNLKKTPWDTCFATVITIGLCITFSLISPVFQYSATYGRRPHPSPWTEVPAQTRSAAHPQRSRFERCERPSLECRQHRRP